MLGIGAFRQRQTNLTEGSPQGYVRDSRFMGFARASVSERQGRPYASPRCESQGRLARVAARHEVEEGVIEFGELDTEVLDQVACLGPLVGIEESRHDLQRGSYFGRGFEDVGQRVREIHTR